MNNLSPLIRHDHFIYLGKQTWKIVKASNAITVGDSIYVSLYANSELEMKTLEAAEKLAELLRRTASWPGFSNPFIPVIEVEIRDSVPCICWK